MVEGKSARQLMFSFSAGRGAGAAQGHGQAAGRRHPYRPPSIAEMEEMATVELEGIISDLGNPFFPAPVTSPGDGPDASQYVPAAFAGSG